MGTLRRTYQSCLRYRRSHSIADRERAHHSVRKKCENILYLIIKAPINRRTR